MRVFQTGLHLLAVWLLIQSTSAAPMPARYREPLRQIYSASQAPGMVAAISVNGQTFVQGFGRTNARNSKTPNQDTLLRLNSLSKLFAGEIVAGLDARGKLAPGDRLQKHALPGQAVPNLNPAGPITIKSLIVHTSSFPRDVPASIWTSGSNTQDQRWKWLVQLRRPAAQPGEALYSNAAWLFLGDAIASAGAKPYSDQLNALLRDDLRLTATSVNPTRTQCAKLLSPEAPVCSSGADTAASWGVYSTASDVMHWMAKLWTAEQGTPLQRSLMPLIARTELSSAPTLDFAGRAEAVGYGWVFTRVGDARVLQKTGGGGKSMNYLIVSPEKKCAVFITVSRMNIAMLRRLTRDANKLMANIMDEAS